MRDRGMIKWMPFDSVTSSKKMVQNILLEKSKVSKSHLSEEQILEIEEKVWEGFHNQIPLNIIYYYQGQYRKKQNLLILDLQMDKKRMILEDHSILYFDQITGVSLT